MSTVTGKIKISDFLERYKIHPVFGVRLITYPLTALSTFVNFWLISSEYGNSLFNLFLVAWMLTGTVQILEYALGVEIMNSVAIAGFQKTIIRKVCIHICALFLILLATYLVFNLPMSQNQLNHYLMRFPSTSYFNTDLLISVFFIVLFLSGSSQLLSRILLGMRMNVSTQIMGAAGYILCSIILVVYGVLVDKPQFLISFAIGISPIAISIIPAIYLVSRLKPLQSDIPDNLSRQFTGVQYGGIYLFVSLLSTFNVYFPRVMTSLKGIELTTYLMTFTVIGIFMNISSSLSQFLWVENLKTYPSGIVVLKRYKRAIKASFFSFPLFVLASLFLFTVYAKLKLSGEIWTLTILSFLFFVLQNIHLISSSLILSKKNLIYASTLLTFHNLFLLLFYRNDEISFSAATYLLVLIITSVLINYIPSLLLVRRIVADEN